MVPRLGSAGALCVLGTALLAPVPARAEPPGADKSGAAEAFDEGVKRFENADYPAAARAFLRADRLAPNDDAITNAISAARRANDHLLVAEAAERGIARASTSPELGVRSREALAVAAKSLARVEIRCEPAPCNIVLDSLPVQAGARYLLPGNHVAVATTEDGRRSEDGLALIAGATYSVVLHTAKQGEAAQSAAVSSSGGAAPRERDIGRAPKPLPPAVFYVGAGVTVVVAGITTWSGLDTLSARDRLPERPTSAQNRAVESKILRSNLLFGGSVLAGTATLLAGLFWVDWEGRSGVATGVVPLAGGALASASGRF